MVFPREMSKMDSIKFRGETTVGEKFGLRVPSDCELRSRFKETVRSNWIDNGKAYAISPMYGNRPDIMDRRK